jgi:hypothetical protein
MSDIKGVADPAAIRDAEIALMERALESIAMGRPIEDLPVKFGAADEVERRPRIARTALEKVSIMRAWFRDSSSIKNKYNPLARSAAP